MRFSRIQTAVILTITAMVFAFSLYHASWLAPAPLGRPNLLANSGVPLPTGTDGCIMDAQAGYGAADVPADIRMLQAAVGNGAAAVNVPTEISNGSVMIPRLFKSTCAADNARPRASLSDAIPVLTGAELFVRIDSAADVPAILAAIPAASKHVFYGSDDAVAAVKQARPGARGFAITKARACAADYGWTGGVPSACDDGVALLTLSDLGFTLWGWPNRYLARMKDANVRVIIAQDVNGSKITGLTTAEQYGDIADSFNGTIWIDDIAALGPALKR
jgi:hypothetical protein